MKIKKKQTKSYRKSLPVQVFDDYRKLGLAVDNEQSLQEWYAQYLRGLGVLFCASCGGMRTGIQTARKMKSAGYNKGFPDMGIFEPRGQYHGMFVELKVNNTPTEEQKEWQIELTKRGYYSVIMPKMDFSDGCKFLINLTEKYLKESIEGKDGR